MGGRKQEDALCPPICQWEPSSQGACGRGAGSRPLERKRKMPSGKLFWILGTNGDLRLWQANLPLHRWEGEPIEDVVQLLEGPRVVRDHLNR